MVYQVESRLCIICGACMIYCPVGAIMKVKRYAFIAPDLCIGCGNCVYRCLTRAIRPVSAEPPSDTRGKK